MLLAELVCLSNQAQDHNGTILAGGRLYVYYKGRTALATTYVDPAGNVENTNPIILDNMGRCSVYASANYSYTLVWCDMYGREKFSYDKDLLDPVPVEDTYSIGIKGDDTIQVNQSTSGQTVVFNLHAKGEDYNGIEPIVVNNDSREISANHKPLGVEAPLFFAQDDEEATIIGMDPDAVAPLVEPFVYSAVSAISGNFATSSFVIQQTSGKQDKLTPGSYVEITQQNVINVTGVQPAGSYATVNDFVGLSGYINEHEAAWTSGKEYSAGANINITNDVISGKDWTTDIQNATSGLAGKLDASAFSAFTATADVTPYSAGNNVTIENHVISLTGDLGKIYSGQNHVVVDNTNDKIGLDASALSAIDAFQGEFDLSAGDNIAFRLEGHTMYIDGQAGGGVDYQPIIEDI